jgi:hypothetical protein
VFPYISFYKKVKNILTVSFLEREKKEFFRKRAKEQKQKNSTFTLFY